MSDLYSVIPGLVPTAQELQEGELLVKQILEAQFVDLELREGTGLRDLVIRPSAMLFALCKKATDYYFTQYTIKGVTDVTPPDLVDGILSNWFLTRNIGIKSVINARLYFARSKNVSVTSDVYFSTDNVIKFFPVESSSFAAAALTYDSFADEYYIDIDMLAEQEGAAYNIGSGSLLYFSNFDPYFLRAEINYLKEESIDSETNLQFIDRAKNAISTRNLINVPSVDGNLRAAFNYISRLITVGMGEPEMIRDQIKAVFDDENPRTLTSLSSIGLVATAVLSNHGYNSGQRIQISNVTPDGYNGQYIITVVDLNTFTFTLASSLGAVTSTATVNAVNLPLLIHNGGMVDIYCTDKIASSIIQVTTDEFGSVNLTGPIYSFTRSSVTGGADDDTIPLNNETTVDVVSIVGTLVTITTDTPHNFLLTDIVTLDGASQVNTLTSLTSSGVTATATYVGHGYFVGNNVIISGATPDSYNGIFPIVTKTTNTFTYTLPTVLSSPATGTITAEVNLLNGPHVLSAVASNSFTFNLPQTSVTAVTGTITASSPVRYTFSNPYDSRREIVTLVSTGTEVTGTVTRHGYTVGRYVKITDASISAFNGTFLITSIPNTDQFVFSIPVGTVGTSTVGTASFVTPWYDYGFSQKQIIQVDFEPSNANKTVSFNIEYFQNLDSIQTYLESETNRVLCGDYLARGLNFYSLHVEVTSYNDTAPSSTLVDSVVSDYLQNLDTGEMFVMSDMVSKLRLNGIINIQNPPLVTYKKYTRDQSPVITGTITDILDPNDRTNVFLLESVSTFSKNIAVDNTIQAL